MHTQTLNRAVNETMHGMCRMNEMKWKKRDEEEKSQRASCMERA